MPQDTFRTRTVQRMTGFSAGVLRAWERRFGLLQPERTDGGHRLYTPDDLRVLYYLREQMQSGRSIGELAARGRPGILAAAPALPVDVADPSPAPRRPGPSDWSPGSRGFLVLETRALQAGLVDGAVALDAEAVERALERTLTLLDGERAVDEVFMPAVARVGDLWESGGCSVAGEHLLTGAVEARVQRLLMYAHASVGPAAPEVLCACFPDETHSLPALVAALRLATAGYRTTWLGGALPFDALEAAIAQRRPAAVVLSVTLPGLYAAQRAQLAALLERVATRVFVGGSDAPSSDPALQSLGLGLGTGDPAPLLRAAGLGGRLR
jgi:methanogenic corrinoid protein MtbC1